jgi:hypothetical protein
VYFSSFPFFPHNRQSLVPGTIVVIVSGRIQVVKLLMVSFLPVSWGLAYVLQSYFLGHPHLSFLRFIWNVGTLVPHCTTTHRKRHYLPPLELQMFVCFCDSYVSAWGWNKSLYKPGTIKKTREFRIRRCSIFYPLDVSVSHSVTVDKQQAEKSLSGPTSTLSNFPVSRRRVWVIETDWCVAYIPGADWKTYADKLDSLVLINGQVIVFPHIIHRNSDS